MNFNFSKLKTFLFKPDRAWEKFIWFVIFFAVAAFIFSGWVYYRFYFIPIEGDDLAEVSILKTKSFNKALERLDQKSEKFKNYRNNLIIEDPS